MNILENTEEYYELYSYYLKEKAKRILIKSFLNDKKIQYLNKC